jgi:hypothetical protein
MRGLAIDPFFLRTERRADPCISPTLSGGLAAAGAPPAHQLGSARLSPNYRNNFAPTGTFRALGGQKSAEPTGEAWPARRVRSACLRMNLYRRGCAIGLDVAETEDKARSLVMRGNSLNERALL